MNIVLATLHVRRSAQAVSLAAASLASALPNALRGKVRLLDFFPEQDDAEILDAIIACRPNMVALPLYSWNRTRLLRVTRELRRKDSRVFLLAGGPEASAQPREVMNEGDLDAVIRGEGESSFARLASHLSKGGPLPSIPGLVLRSIEESGSGELPPEETPGDFPSPWLSGVLSPGEGVLWEITRGCPFNCDFCYDARGSRKIRHISRERLESELDLFIRAGASQVWVLDSTFNFPPERGKELLRLIARRNPPIHFHFEAKADFLDAETARLLAKIPCSVQLGLQSADPHILRHVHRTLDLDLFLQKVHLLESEGVTFGFDLIYGLPGDDHQGFRRSLDTALRMNPNTLDIFPLAVLPGTLLDRNRSEFGVEAQRSPPYEIQRSATYSAEDLERSRLLSGAVDLFYNGGRAVAFFPALVKIVKLDPVDFLEEFTRWSLEYAEIERDRFLLVENWTSLEIRSLQQDFISWLLKSRDRLDLLSAARDLIDYHFHYAETLLGAEVLPHSEQVSREKLWDTPWRTAPGLKLVSFTYEIFDLLQMEEVDLEEFVTMFRPVGSTALFLRRGGEVFCESLEEDFSKLLEGCDGNKTPREIFGGSISTRLGEEVVEFALAEGLLIPAR